MQEDRPIVKSPVQAKQGVELHRMRYVLGASLGGAIIALGALVLVFQFHH
jgi:hypothetical protein